MRAAIFFFSFFLNQACCLDSDRGFHMESSICRRHDRFFNRAILQIVFIWPKRSYGEGDLTIAAAVVSVLPSKEATFVHSNSDKGSEKNGSHDNNDDDNERRIVCGGRRLGRRLVWSRCWLHRRLCAYRSGEKLIEVNGAESTQIMNNLRLVSSTIRSVKE